MKIQNEDGIWVDVWNYDGVGSNKVQDISGKVYELDIYTNRYVPALDKEMGVGKE